MLYGLFMTAVFQSEGNVDVTIEEFIILRVCGRVDKTISAVMPSNPNALDLIPIIILALTFSSAGTSINFDSEKVL